MSVTDIEHPPMVKGRLADLVEYDIVINILLYGMTKDAIVANIEPMILSTLSSDGSIINVSSLMMSMTCIMPITISIKAFL